MIDFIEIEDDDDDDDGNDDDDDDDMTMTMITRLSAPIMMVPVLRSHPQQHWSTVGGKGILKKI